MPRRARSTLRALAAPVALAGLLSLLSVLSPLAGCAGAAGDEGAAPPTRSNASAADLAPSQTFEIRFGSELAGYLIDVLPAPDGATDARAYAPGTAVIQSLDGTALGFISRHGTTYRYDASGEARVVGFGSRSTSIAAFFRAIDPPTLVPVQS
ncbi:MAG TPA: hypothetical protein VFD43_08700 [Planctomycetota bacterium]|nr:hypothetical protein [Planctomycetota bacterium]